MVASNWRTPYLETATGRNEIAKKGAGPTVRRGYPAHTHDSKRARRLGETRMLLALRTGLKTGAYSSAPVA